MAAIICPICDRAVRETEGLVIRPIDNGTADIMRVIHVDYSRLNVVILHESDEYKYLGIDYE